MQSVKRIDSVFVPVTNLEKSEEWYLKTFPFEVTYRSSDDMYVGFRFVESGEHKTALTLYKVDKIPQHDHIAFNFYTDDVEEFHRNLTENSYEVGEVNVGDGMHFIEFKDPDGNRIGIVTY